MINSLRTLTPFLLLSVAACTTSEGTDPSIVPPDRGVRPVYSVPGGSAATELLFGEGVRFVFNGATAPGSASFTGAPIVTRDDEPTTGGGGALNITVDGTQYSVASLESYAFLLDDATSYVALVGYAERTGPSPASTIDEVIVIVPASNVVAGATVALDGNDRLALFASGDPEQDEPDVMAAAVTGSVTFTAGSATPGSTVSATLIGDFGSVEFVDDGHTTPGGTTLTDGAYSLALAGSVADVYCDGSLAGQEAAFANITAASLGFTDGAVSIANAGATIAGAPIASAFGSATLALESYDDGLYAGFSDDSSAGPAGTTLVGKYIVLDASSASATFINAGVGAGYATDDGQCSVSFGASLTNP